VISTGQNSSSLLHRFNHHLNEKERPVMKTFAEYIEEIGKPLSKEEICCLQMNIGYMCNLSCQHCHVEAGPHRHEQMSLSVIEDCLRYIRNARLSTVDITGGAPEMHPHFRYIISKLKQLYTVKTIILRSNLTLLSKPENSDIPMFLAENNVEIVASLPCYLEENVNAQRGDDVYKSSIGAIKKLNKLGYGTGEHKLHLVYNPGGDFLPGPQPALEAAYKNHLAETFGISFNNLYTITNMPIGRFRSDLEQQGLLKSYQELLNNSFNPDTLSKLMCNHLISVDWQGNVYDCDFNHILQLPIAASHHKIGDICDLHLTGTPIRVGDHCFACTAGSGSSCQGSLS
jgi:radical SAM/Cys-rich protein